METDPAHTRRGSPQEAQAPADPSLLDRLASLILHSPARHKWLLILAPPLLSLGSAHIARVTLSEYHRAAAFYYDSATYRHQALQLHREYIDRGLLAAAKTCVHARDSLDLLLRLAWPPSLTKRHGQLLVSAPLLAGFLALVIHFVLDRTKSGSLAMAAAVSLIPTSIVTGLHHNLADYFKEELGIWLLGGAVLCWLLSDEMRRPRWLTLCGALLGALLLQRAVLAVFAFCALLPLVLISVVRRSRQSGGRGALGALVPLLWPGALPGAILLLQLEGLKRYYFVAGYGYGSPSQAAKHLLSSLLAPAFLCPLIPVVACVLAALSAHPSRQQLKEMLSAAWVACAIIAVNVALGTMYHGIRSALVVCAVVFLATALPRVSKPETSRALAAVLLSVSAFLFARGLLDTWSQFPAATDRSVLQRSLLLTLGDAIIAQSPSRRYLLAFDEAAEPFLNQVYFDRGILLPDPVARISIHDSYYEYFYRTSSPSDITATVVAALESETGSLCVATVRQADSPADVLHSRRGLAAKVLEAIREHVATAESWSLVQTVPSPYGPLGVYRFDGNR